MPQVRVYNDNVHPYQEEFKGETVKIPSKGSIEMEFYDAHEFLGSFNAPKLDYDGNPTAASYKMLRIETGGALPEIEVVKNVCVACAYKASSEKDLEEHAKASHAHQVLVDEIAEKELKVRKKAG